ncbi:hypothetical protein, partial [Mesorhizobium sp. J18]|uniref:hypothetical protein n=1 Tax=Mesorhizobium sp. J18 TaxID=935263 RepID=UPI001AEE4A6F
MIRNAREQLSDVDWLDCPYEAVQGANAVIILTEWGRLSLTRQLPQCGDDLMPTEFAVTRFFFVLNRVLRGLSVRGRIAGMSPSSLQAG